MTQITFKDGKPIMRDGKVGAGQGCCCDGPRGCCVHYCHKLCCSTIRWQFTLSGCGGYEGGGEGSGDGGTGEITATTWVASNCYATLGLAAYTNSSCNFFVRVKIRCSGYVARIPECEENYPQYDDCDTDCVFVGDMEYSADGVTWSTEQPAFITSISADFDCEQPQAQYGSPRCASIQAVQSEGECNNLEGAYCSTDPAGCEECGFLCPPDISEWRIVDQNGKVWFQGDIVRNQNYIGEICDDPPPPSDTTPFLLDDYVTNTSNGCSLTQYNLGEGLGISEPHSPAALWYSQAASLRLQILCPAVGWVWLTSGGQLPGCPPTSSDLETNINNIFSPYQRMPAWEFYSPECNLEASYVGWWGDIRFRPPMDCSCQIDPSTGAEVAYCDCCRACDMAFIYGGDAGTVGSTCGSGLKYLGHGQAVRFTGVVDTDGGNLANWEDADENYPACWLPNESSFAGGPVSNRSIVIAGTLGRWWEVRRYYSYPSFASVTLEPDSVLAFSLNAETITVDAATVQARHDDWQICGLGDEGAVRINVTGTATFTNGAENRANDRQDFPSGVDFFGNPVVVQAGITGHCVFQSGSKNVGTIRGNCEFSDDARNEGIIEGDCTFSGDAVNAGTVIGNCTFLNNARNEGTVRGTEEVPISCAFSGNASNDGTVEGDCTFTDSSVNEGTVDGDATFSDNATNEGTVTGNATFSGNATNTGTVNDATFANSSFSGDPTLGGVITGTITFSSQTPVSFVLSGSSVWSADASAWVFTTSGQNWTFSSTSSNTGTVNGNATFGGSSVNNGTVTGDATFSGTARMNGNVTGTATFSGGSCYASGTAGAFVPDPPPAC